MSNELTQEAKQHLIEVPSHVLLVGSNNGAKAKKIFAIAEGLKMVRKTQGFSYSIPEFEKEFGPTKQLGYFRLMLKKAGIKKPRIVQDSGKVIVFSNDDR